MQCSGGEMVVPLSFIFKFCTLLLDNPLVPAHLPGPESSADMGQSNYRDKDFQKLNAFIFFPRQRIVQEEPVHSKCPPGGVAITAI